MYLQNLVLSIIAIAETNALTLSPGLVIISNQLYVIFHNTIPRKSVQHMTSCYFANEDAMSMLKPFLLLFSGNVSYQTSNNLCSVSQKLAYSKTNKTEWNRRAKFSFEIDTASQANRTIHP